MKSMNMKTHTPSVYSIGSALKTALALGAAAASLALSAADYDYSGGATPTLVEGDTAKISVAGAKMVYSGSYYDPAAASTVTKNWTVGPAVTTFMPFALAKNYNVTIKSADDSGVWAQLSGDNNHQLITLTEPTSGHQTITLDRLFITGGYGANGGGLHIDNSGNPGSGLTIAGDMIFYNNTATDKGGATNTTRGSMDFTGKLLFANNTAPNGGAIGFTGAGTNNEKLTFRNETVFLGNWTSGLGGAIFGATDTGVKKTVEFYGSAIFEGNRAGVGASDSRHGGAIGGGSTGGDGTRFDIAFYNNVSFQKNTAPGYGGAISTAAGDITFANSGSFNGSRIMFSRNASTGGGTGGSARIGGGAISAGLYNANSELAPSVFFLDSTAKAVFEGNIAIMRSNSGGTSISTNSGVGGAMRASGGIYLLQGEFEFIGNQGAGHGGALYVHSGATALASAYSGHGMIADGNRAKYKIQINGNAKFINNLARNRGGAIATAYENAPGSVYIGSNTEFLNNFAGGDGGAIWFGQALSLLTLDASTGDITFKGNRSNGTVSAVPSIGDIETILANSGSNMTGYMTRSGGNQNDIYFNGNSSVVELNAEAGRTIYMDGGINGGGSVEIAVTKTGAGLMVFGTGAASNIKTNTQVQAGTFKIDGASYGNGSGRVTVAGGATLAGSGTIRENTITQMDSTIIVGNINDNAARTLAFGNGLSINSGTLRVDFFSTNAVATTYDNISVTGEFAASGITYVDVAGLANGTYDVITASSFGASTAGNNFRLMTYSGTLTKRNLGSTIVVDGNKVTITGTMLNLATTWNSTSGVWRDGVDTSWASTTDASEKYFRNNDSVTFGDTGAGMIAIDAAGVRVADMTVNSAANYTFTGTSGVTTANIVSGTFITATEKLVKKGAGTLTFQNNANTFNGGIEIDAGTLAFNKTSQINTGTAGISFTGNASLKLNAANMTMANALYVAAGKTGTLDMGGNKLTYTGALTGSGTLAKTGSAALVLVADNSAFAGASDVKQGALVLNNGSKLGGAITLENGAKLEGTGASTGSLTANAGSVIHAGFANSATAQTLALNNLTMNGATLSMNLYNHAPTQTANSADTLSLTGAYTVGVGTNILDVQTLKIGEYNLGNFGDFTGQNYTVLIAGQSQVGARQSAVIANVGGNLILTTTSDDNRKATWTGASGSSVWNISGANWNAAGSSAHSFAGGDAVVFDSTSDTAGTRTIMIEGSANVSDMEVNGGANYTFTGGGIKADSSYRIGSLISSGGQLIKNGAGTLTFENAANSFKGGITINGGAIAFNDGSQINTNGVGIHFGDNGSLIAKANNMTLSENIDIAIGKTATINTNGNTLTYTGEIAALGLDSTFEKSGAGTLYLTGNNASYDAQTTVAAGSLLLSGSHAALGGNVSVAANATFGGAGHISGNVSVSGSAHLQVGENGGALVSTGPITMLNKSVLTGSGTLAATTMALGAAAGERVYANIAGGDNVTVTGTVTGRGLQKQGAGTLTMVGDAATQYAESQIDEGVLYFKDATGAVAQTVTLNGGWLALEGSGTSRKVFGNLNYVSGANAAQGGITGTNAVVILGAGTTAFMIGTGTTDATNDIQVWINPGAGKSTTLTGSNRYTGVTFVDSGTLVISKDYQLGDGSGATLSLWGGELRITGTAGSETTFGRALGAAKSSAITVDAGVEATWSRLTASSTNLVLAKDGEGSLTFTAAASGTNLVTVNLKAGTLGLGSANALGAPVEDGGPIMASSTINILGANTTLRLGNRTGYIGDAVNINANSLNMEVQTGVSATYAGVIAGSGDIIKTGAGELILANRGETPNAYSGATRINEGTLRIGNKTALSPNSANYIIGAQGLLNVDGIVNRLPNIANKGVMIVGYSSAKGNGLLPNGTGTSGYVGRNGSLVYDDHGTLYQTNKLVLDNYHGDANSVVILNWGLTSATDYTIKTDSIGVAPGGTVSGTTTIVFSYQGKADSKLVRRGADPYALAHNIVDDNVKAGLVFSGTFSINNLLYAFRADEYDDLVIEKLGVVPEVVAAKAVDTVALFSGKAALDSLGRRFTALRTETGMPAKGYDLWLGGVYREDTLRESIYKGFSVKTQGAQFGLDFIDRTDRTGVSNFFLGVAFDYVKSTADSDVKSKSNLSPYSGYQMGMIQNWSGATTTENSAFGVSVYGGMQDGPWYIDATMRASKDNYTVRLRDNPDYKLEMPGSSFGGSIETGYAFGNAESGWVFEPQAQIIMQRTSVDPTPDNSADIMEGERGMIYKMDTVQSMAGRVGLKVMKGFEYKPGCKITPYVRGSILHEFAGDNKLTVNNETEVRSNLSGSVGIFEAGLTWRLSKHFDVSLDSAYSYGTKYNGYSFNLGARYNW